MHVWKEMILFFRKQGGVSGKGCRWWQLLEMMMITVEDEDMEVSLPAMDLHTNTFCHHFPSKKHTQYAKLRCMNNNIRTWQTGKACPHCYSEAAEVILGLYITVKLWREKDWDQQNHTITVIFIYLHLHLCI